MAKTNFTNGDILTPDFMDTLYYTDGGHKHDGSDNDGHASKIDLTAAAEVTGVLPAANYTTPSLGVTGSGGTNGLLNYDRINGGPDLSNYVDRSSDQSIGGDKDFSGDIHVDGTLSWGDFARYALTTGYGSGVPSGWTAAWTQMSVNAFFRHRFVGGYISQSSTSNTEASLQDMGFQPAGIVSVRGAIYIDLLFTTENKGPFRLRQMFPLNDITGAGGTNTTRYATTTTETGYSNTKNSACPIYIRWDSGDSEWLIGIEAGVAVDLWVYSGDCRFVDWPS